MTAEVRRTRLEPIERAECLELLDSTHIGRLAVVVGGQPLVFPVTYALHEQAIVFRTDPGTKLFGALDGPVAFEVDGLDGSGWSVLVTGRAEVVAGASDVQALSRLDLGPWNPGPKQHWVRVRGTISGRRLVVVQ